MMKEVHVRECQECGHRQVMKDPSTMKHENWREAKCRKCKSEALDFGQMMLQDEKGELHRISEELDED